MSFSIGENIGPYRISEQLGQGGMATVYKAYHAALDRYVALKVLHPAFNEDKSFELRFQREARVVAKLEHPNIVPIYDYAEHEHRPYLVMKFIEGETLKARLQRGPLSAGEIQRVVDSVGAALSYAHTQGILHRDIKPSNVLIAADGAMYLADFGLARIAQAGESTLSSDSIMGTPQYISPEQAMGKKELDNGTDIYSFAVMLYEMVVGQVPFNADTPFSIIHDHIYTPLPMPRKVNAKVPETVERVLLKALSKDRADRYATVDDLVMAFKQAWAAAGVPMRGTAITLPRSAAMQPTLPPAPSGAAAVQTEAGQGSRKKSFPWAVVAGIVVLLLCALVGLAAFRNGGLLRQRANPTLMPLPTQALGNPPPMMTLMPVTTPGGELPPLDEVQKNPNDPNAQLTLALSYWDAGQRRQALETLTQAANLAPQDRAFLLKAAQEFQSRQAWVPASAMYVRLMRTYPPSESAPPEVMGALREAVYKAAGEADFGLFLQLDLLERMDQPLALVVRGRAALFGGKLDEARSLLDQARKLKPDLREARLLEAEILVKEGRAEEAGKLLNDISADSTYSEWMRVMAKELLDTLP